jgi:hypothetical protein
MLRGFTARVEIEFGRRLNLPQDFEPNDEEKSSIIR